MTPFDLIDDPLDAALDYIADNPGSSIAKSYIKLIRALYDDSSDFQFRTLLGLDGHYLQLGLSLIHARCYGRYNESDWFQANEWCQIERAKW